MPAQPILATHAETATAAPDDGRLDDGPRSVPVPSHFPITDAPLRWPAPGVDPGPDAGPGPAGPAGAGRGDPADGGQAWTRQFAVLLTEALAGVRPVRQLLPWLSERGRAHLQRLLPLFADGHQPRIIRVLTARPAPDVMEMTLVVTVGPRTRALAVRLEQAAPARRAVGPGKLARPDAGPHTPPQAQWRCTDIEAA